MKKTIKLMLLLVAAVCLSMTLRGTAVQPSLSAQPSGMTLVADPFDDDDFNF